MRFAEKLTIAMLPDTPALREPTRALVEQDAAAFAVAAMAQAPWHIRTALSVLRFALWIWLAPGGGLQLSPPHARARSRRGIRMFAKLAGPAANLVRAHESLGAFAMYDTEPVAGLVTGEAQRARIYRKRTERQRLISGLDQP